jgi:hypothetical protein
MTYNEAKWLAMSHELGARSKDAVEAIEDGLAKLARISVYGSNTRQT